MNSEKRLTVRCASGLGLLVLSMAVAGCDLFWGLRSSVVDAATGRPISNAKVYLVLDKGVGEPPRTVMTDQTGQFQLMINEPVSAWCTVTISKDGYQTWSTQFQEAPRDTDFVVKLVPVGGTRGN